MKTVNAEKYSVTKSLTSYFVMLLIMIFVSGFVKAENEDYLPGEKSQFSLLTASPGKVVYQHYGHTGLRFTDPQKGLDIVFNYGLFDFSSPNFLWRFITGQTDYVVGTYSYSDFLIEYQMENRTVTEQVLNLKTSEINTLWKLLVENIKPENRVYRYNFFYENCSTKPRDIIEKAIDGKVDYKWDGKFKSLRDEVHFFTKDYNWTRFGIDFALGAEADEKATLKTQQFAPEVLMESFSKAIITNDSLQTRPLVISTSEPVKTDLSIEEDEINLPGPVPVMWALFIITLFITWTDLKKKKVNHILNAILYTSAGILGALIAFLVFFSEHPTTEINYLLLWLNPLYLIYLPGLISSKFRNRGLLLTIAILIPLQLYSLAGSLYLPQSLNAAAYPLLLSLMTRAVSGWLYYRSKK